VIVQDVKAERPRLQSRAFTKHNHHLERTNMRKAYPAERHAAIPFGSLAAEFLRRCAADPAPTTWKPAEHKPAAFYTYTMQRWGCLAVGVLP